MPIFPTLWQYIKLFTSKNAKMFGAKVNKGYWWPNTKEGYEQRRKYVDWMISELEKQL